MATFATYKHNKLRRDGRSIKIEHTLDKNDGINDIVRKLKCPIVFLKQERYHLKKYFLDSEKGRIFSVINIILLFFLIEF